MILFTIKKKSGYSLLEVLVTLAIVCILLLMLSQIMLIAIKSSVKVEERAIAREEMTKISNMIQRDIRNSNSLDSDCTAAGGSSICTVSIEGKKVRWGICGLRVCRYTWNGQTSQYSIDFQSSPKLNVTIFNFEIISTNSSYTPSLLVTMAFNHNNPTYNIQNLNRQFIISPRNYLL